MIQIPWDPMGPMGPMGPVGPIGPMGPMGQWHYKSKMQLQSIRFDRLHGVLNDWIVIIAISIIGLSRAGCRELDSQ